MVVLEKGVYCIERSVQHIMRMPDLTCSTVTVNKRFVTAIGKTDCGRGF